MTNWFRQYLGKILEQKVQVSESLISGFEL